MTRLLARGRAVSGLTTSLILLLGVGGCFVPVFPESQRHFVFAGEVRRGDTGVPVSGALLEIQLVHPADPSLDAAIHRAQTDASGRYRIALRMRVEAAPQEVSVRVVPPAGSGLAERTLEGGVGDVFDRVTRRDQHYTYELNVVLDPSAAEPTSGEA